MVQKTGSMPALDAEHTEGHPSLSKYVGIAIFLAIITGIEVAIYYVDALSSILVPTLIVLSAVKFVTVIGYFMHLRFDGKLLSMIFGAALVVALAVYVAVDVMMDAKAVNVFFGGQ
jgi:cytochrome c oxidase subunit 4